MAELETIDDEAHAADIDFVKIKDEKLAKSYGVHALPAIVYFKHGDPTIYTGDLRKGSSVLAWLLQQKNPDAEDVIEEIKGAELEKLIDTSPSVAVFFYTADSKESQSALNDLENIDDETDSLGVSFVKTSDTKIARDYGVKHFPALIYFEEGQPSIYDGNLKEEEEVLVWLTHQKNEDTIENVNKEILEKKIEDSEYLAVFFCKRESNPIHIHFLLLLAHTRLYNWSTDKPNCKECDAILEVLESIDDDLDAYGVDIVRIHDMNLSKRYGIKDVPALLYFRNGNPLMYTGRCGGDLITFDITSYDAASCMSGELDFIQVR